MALEKRNHMSFRISPVNSPPNGPSASDATSVPALDEESFQVVTKRKSKAEKENRSGNSTGHNNQPKKRTNSNASTGSSNSANPNNNGSVSSSSSSKGGKKKHNKSKVAGTAEPPSSPSASISSSKSKNTLFAQLLRNVNHAVDELYSQCEAENETDFARDASKILKRCSDDFTALEKRIRMQGEYIFLNADAQAKRKKGYAKNNRNVMASVSWDVRKSSTDKRNVMVRSSIERMEREAQEQREMNHFVDEEDIDEQVHDDNQPSPAARLPSENAWSKRIAFDAPNESIGGNSLEITGTKAKIYVSDGRLPAPTTSAVQVVTVTNFVTAEAAAQYPPATTEMSQSDFGERIYTLLYPSQGDLAGKITGMLLELDSSDLVALLNSVDALNVKVAEALQVLKEYEATQAAQNSNVVCSEIVVENNNQSGDDFVDIVDESETDKEEHEVSEQQDIDKVLAEAMEWVERVSKAEESAWSDFLNKSKNEKLTLECAPIAESPRSNHAGSWYSSSEEGEDEDLSHRGGVGVRGGVKGGLTPRNLPKSKNHLRTPINSTGEAGHYTPLYNLHDKLSSPDRRRPSPAETKQKMDERAAAAAQRRADAEKKKQRKLAKAAEKIERARTSLEAKHQQKITNISEKMRLAEEQAQRHKAAKIKKAESENSKVTEISFINALNERDLAEQMRQKLLETENRIKAARERRQAAQKQTTNKNEMRREKNSKVLSERESEREEAQASRLEQLQARMQAVSERRSQRMAEAEKMAELKRQKMLEAARARQAREEKILQRSAEKETKRNLADARRSGDFNSNESPLFRLRASSFGANEDLDASNSDTLAPDVEKERDSLDDVRLLSPPVTSNTATAKKKNKAKKNRAKTDSVPAEDDETTQQPNELSEEQVARSLIAKIDAAIQSLSRDEKKKRRKRLAAARKKIGDVGSFLDDNSNSNGVNHENHDYGGGGGGGGDSIPPKLASIYQRIANIASNFKFNNSNNNNNDDSLILPNDNTKWEAKNLDGEIYQLVKFFDKKSPEAIGDNYKSLVSATVTILVKLYKDLLTLNHRLHFSQTLSGVVVAIEIVTENHPNVAECLFGAKCGDVFIDGAVRLLAHQSFAMMMRSYNSNGNIDGSAVRLLTKMLSSTVTSVRADQIDLMRYLVLTPLCDSIVAALRSVTNLPALSSGLMNVLYSLGPFVETLATFSFDESTIGNNVKERGTEVAVHTFDDIARINNDPISISLKECLVEKIGGSLIGVVASVLPLANQGSAGAGGIASFEVCVEGGQLSAMALNALVTVCKLDLRRFQVLCRGETKTGWEGGGGYLEFSYVAGVVCQGVAKICGEKRDEFLESCLEKMIVLLGLYTLENAENQQRLNWGSDETLLSRLSSLPFKYFCEGPLIEILFPTLISATSFNDNNRAVISNDINLELLAGYLSEKMENIHSPSSIALSHRIPCDTWGKLKAYYE